MKKLFLTALAALMVGAGAMAQEPEQAKDEAKKEEAAPKEEKKKKGGGFLKKLAKGVESVTGLDVSKETLFVYPTVADWKMSLVSCVGNPKTGELVIKINCLKITGTDQKGLFPRVTEVRPAGTDTKLKLEMYSKHYEFRVGVPTEVTFLQAKRVPTDVTMLDMKFHIANPGEGPSELDFEARDMPITWQAE